MVTLKTCETKEFQHQLQQLHWKGQGKDEDHVKDGETRMKWTEI